MKKIRNLLLGLSAALVFSVLYATDTLSLLEDRLYDLFLRFRPERELLSDIVFLDVDDLAISYYGIFPWPRAIPADGLLRLKEYGARAAILDIEYIDKGPQGVDSLYLDYGLSNDFDRSFTEIDISARELFSAIRNGWIPLSDVDDYANSFSRVIDEKRNDLYIKAQTVARDNDLYLAQAIALFGRGWSTLGLRPFHLEGEEAERRFLAQERFSITVNAAPNVSMGDKYIDILPALPIFSRAAKGAGFTNAEVDRDGVRRRIYLVQNIFDHWYTQLAFAPLLNYLGNPEIYLEKRKMTLKQAHMPDGGIKDIVIPMDHLGRVMLDWPKENYYESYTHVSFANFSLLDQMEAELDSYSRALASSQISFFTQFDPLISDIPDTLNYISMLFDEAAAARNTAMEETGSNIFNEYLECRNYAHELLGEILELDIEERMRQLTVLLSEEYEDLADVIEDEAEYILSLINVLAVNLNRYRELTADNFLAFNDKFVIIGRVDMGTTDIGVNPFHGQYNNVGTHGVVLNTILAGSFITPLSFWWSILIMIVFVPLFFHVTGSLAPVIRAAFGFAAVLILLAGAVLLFRFTGIYIGSLGITLAMLSALIIREIYSYAHSEKEKHFIRTAFSTYVSGDVVKEIISNPSRLQLGGTKRHMTAIFTDVKGFSSISEQLDPEELVRLLNKYLSAMSDIILVEKGTIDKYEGDAIIAFFGAPLELKDHALRACISAIKLKKAEAELNKTILEHKLSPLPLLTRIGVNTGSMVAGNMGTADKMNYTIMGNAVNLAARLEGVNKQYGTWILASEYTINETENNLLYRQLDRVRVVGINEPVRLCELIDMADTADEPDKRMVMVFHQALADFEQRNWKQAALGFKEARSIKSNDEPSKIFLERSIKFHKSPPEDSWDGVYNLTSK
ncbi:MAG: CHASE2 domain-containing protein [Treponema sp.]|nr:CHASE2 domain-containing protein [Treponema sp.]